MPKRAGAALHATTMDYQAAEKSAAGGRGRASGAYARTICGSTELREFDQRRDVDRDEPPIGRSSG
jgi:hypothetical protein